MENFSEIYQRAIQRKGKEDSVCALLSKPKTTSALAALTADNWLEELSRKIFQSGFYWQVIHNKYAGGLTLCTA